MRLERLKGVLSPRIENNQVLILRHYNMASKELIKIANYLISTYSLGKFAGTDDEEGLAWQDTDPWESRWQAEEISETPEEEGEDEPWDESWEESEEDEPGDYGNWPVIPSAKPEEPEEKQMPSHLRFKDLQQQIDPDRYRMRRDPTKKDYKGEYKPWQH